MRHARGQALVLLALTLLVLCVGLAMTLSIGNRAKERVELQTLTDGAAYSTAAATARSFNAFATLNRAAVSHWVALSGTEALIAWGGPAGAPLNAHNQAKDIHNSVARIDVLEEKIYEDLIFEVIEDGRYQRAAAALGEGNPDPGRGMPYTPPWGQGNYVGSQTACREVCHAVNDGDLDLQDHDDLDLAEIAQAVQGSRGHVFTVLGTPTEAVHTYIRDESSPAALWARIDNDDYADADWSVPKSGYKPDADEAYSVVVNRWQSISAVSYPMPAGGPWMKDPPLGAGAAAVISTSEDDDSARFGAWSGAVGENVPFSAAAKLHARANYWQDLPGDTGPLRLTHTVPKHPGVFRGGFGFVDGVRFRAGKSGPYTASPAPTRESDLFGQPKLAMMLWRYQDPNNPPSYPWELVFRFKFSSSGPGSNINLKRGKMMEMGTDSFLFHTMGALASGLAYYHRPGHLAEPANMLNPYWRATLVPTDIDDNGQSMMEALAHIPEIGSPEHEQHWLAGWRPGDIGMLIKNGAPRSYPELLILEYRLINQGGFTAVP